ncbi:hypothetical protein FRB99_003070 [Tulasnella sp. 403]|nr:hypothetical protein FRB99_003070 [Tulasnella sp. 403]
MESVPQEYCISGKIKILKSDYPAASGGFAKLYIGEHPVHGRVALKHVSIARSLEEERSVKVQEQTLEIYETADALRYLHTQRIIHGDIKGSNILLSSSTQALLCDFGMSRMVGDATKPQLKGGGSHRWMAPEIFDGKPKSFKSDVFSFGMTIYELLSGKLPLHNIEDSVVAAVALTRGRRPLREPECSPSGESYEAIWNIAESCWQEEPEGRPPIDKLFSDLSLLPAALAPPFQETSEVPKEMKAPPTYEFIRGKIRVDIKNMVSRWGSCPLYKGRHPKHGDVALKYPSWNLIDRYEDMFLVEIASQFPSHRHILEFHGFYEEDSRVYLVFPWVDNGSLPSYLLRNPNADRARFLRETADALNHLFQQNIVHGSIKGNNILVSATKHALLCDSGISKLEPPASTLLPLSNSLRYAAPELWDGQPKSFATDVFAFGMTISEVLSGNVPFQAYESVPAVVIRVSNGVRPPREPNASPVGDSYSPLWDVAERCWQAVPADGPSAAEIFRTLLELSPVAMTPPDRDNVPSTEVKPYQRGQTRSLPKSGLAGLLSTMTRALTLPRPSTSRLSGSPMIRTSLFVSLRGWSHWPVHGGRPCFGLWNPFNEGCPGNNFLFGVYFAVTIALGGGIVAVRDKNPLYHSECSYIMAGTDERARKVAVKVLKHNPYGDNSERIKIVQAASALAYLHENSIIHGYIKVSNILVSSGSKPQALLSDFGWSRPKIASTMAVLTKDDVLQAPELWESSPKSFRSDCYSFGLTIYEVRWSLTNVRDG